MPNGQNNVIGLCGRENQRSFEVNGSGMAGGGQGQGVAASRLTLWMGDPAHRTRASVPRASLLLGLLFVSVPKVPFFPFLRFRVCSGCDDSRVALGLIPSLFALFAVLLLCAKGHRHRHRVQGGQTQSSARFVHRRLDEVTEPATVWGLIATSLALRRDPVVSFTDSSLCNLFSFLLFFLFLVRYFSPAFVVAMWGSAFKKCCCLKPD